LRVRGQKAGWWVRESEGRQGEGEREGEGKRE
jgi:hypothetical protein